MNADYRVSDDFILIHRAARKGDVDTVDQLMRKMDDVETKQRALSSVDDSKSNPLHLIAYSSRFTPKQENLEALQRLLSDTLTDEASKRAILEATDRNQSTPLYCAIVGRNSEIVKILLDHGADPNHPDLPTHMLSATILSCGGRSEQTQILIHELLKHGADPDPPDVDDYKQSPFSVACQFASIYIVALLVEHGAQSRTVSRSGLTPLHCAARFGRDDIIHYLLNNDEVKARHQWDPLQGDRANGNTPLHLAMRFTASPETAHQLLEHSAWARPTQDHRPVVSKFSLLHATNLSGENPLDVAERSLKFQYCWPTCHPPRRCDTTCSRQYRESKKFSNILEVLEYCSHERDDHYARQCLNLFYYKTEPLAAFPDSADEATVTGPFNPKLNPHQRNLADHAHNLLVKDYGLLSDVAFHIMGYLAPGDICMACNG